MHAYLVLVMLDVWMNCANNIMPLVVLIEKKRENKKKKSCAQIFNALSSQSIEVSNFNLLRERTLGAHLHCLSS